jgi:V8-like Glu-specific endopeptidase
MNKIKKNIDKIPTIKKLVFLAGIVLLSTNTIFAQQKSINGVKNWNSPARLQAAEKSFGDRNFQAAFPSYKAALTSPKQFYAQKIWFFEKDDRELIDKKDFQHAVVSVEGSGGKATGSIIHKCYMVANNHLVKTSKKKIEFYSSYLKKSVKAMPVLLGDPVNVGKDGENDYAIFKIIPCLPEDHPKFLVSGNKNLFSVIKRKELKFSFFGYHGDKISGKSHDKLMKSNKIYVDPDCSVTHEALSDTSGGGSEKLFFHDCASYKGASGGPIVYSKGKKPILIAMHVASLTTGACKNKYKNLDKKKVQSKDIYLGDVLKCGIANAAIPSYTINEALEKVKLLYGEGDH